MLDPYWRLEHYLLLLLIDIEITFIKTLFIEFLFLVFGIEQKQLVDIILRLLWTWYSDKIPS